MALIRRVYKCNVCGNIVEVLHEGFGQLVCCGKPMQLLDEKVAEEGREKHVPVVEVLDGLVRVKVGSKPHPMEEKHYVEWIEVAAGDDVYRKHLKPGQAPEAEFKVGARTATARIYCNIHGLWRNP